MVPIVSWQDFCLQPFVGGRGGGGAVEKVDGTGDECRYS